MIGAQAGFSKHNVLSVHLPSQPAGQPISLHSVPVLASDHTEVLWEVLIVL